VNAYRNSVRVFLFSVLGSCILFPSCGKKDLPVPPRRLNPPAVIDLQHRIEDNQVELSWTVPQKKRRRQTDLDGFKIYRSKIILSEASCENCPLKFTMVRDIPLLKKDKKKPLKFSDSLDPGYSYTYVVRGYGDNSMISADSNAVKFVFE